MQSIFQSCEPRPEVLSGDLREEIFAARLRDVIEGRADQVYQDPVTFFDNTYPTEGLKLVLKEALGRLTGVNPANNAIIRLETAFGGGKTHNLIALYHAVCGHVPGEAFVDDELVPPPNAIQVAGIVGSDLDSSQGIDHGDVTTYTLWGEIAYQLGKASDRAEEFYTYVAQSEHDKTAPGTSLVEKLIGDFPTLIMLDEIARHLRAAKTVPTATGRSDLAEQTVAFLMSLFEFAASKQQVVVVFTLADSADAFGKETDELKQQMAQVITEAGRVAARQERVITPTAETEIAAIVTHRLFRAIEADAASETAQAYADYYRQCAESNADVPQRALRAEYIQEIAYDYPFHPELLTALNRRVSTITNFQKTRGALRLLAMVVRDLWRYQRDDVTLIHPHHINLAVEEIANDLTSRLERPRFKQVIEADIASPLSGSQSHAQALDEKAGGTSYTQYVGVTAFLHSLTQGVSSGIDPSDLTLAVIQPGDDPALVVKAANRLTDNGWFFEYDGHRYRFKPEPSINKIVADEMGLVGLSRVRMELDLRIRQVWKKGLFRPVPASPNALFPSEPGDVDDDADAPPRLVIMHYDAAISSVEDTAPPDLVARIFTYTGTQEGYRRFKNNLVFLVADQGQRENMVNVAQRYLAVGRIVNDPGRMGEFYPEQRQKLDQMYKSAELEVRIAITKAYRWLYYPSGDAPQTHSNLVREQLPPQDQGDVNRDQGEVVLRVLKNLDKAQVQDSSPLPAQLVRAKAWDVGQTHLSTEDLRQAFARKMSLRMMFDITQLKKTIRNGIEKGIWIYYDARAQEGYSHVSPPPEIQISEDATLYTLEEYARLDWPIKGVKRPEPEPEPKPGQRKTGGTGRLKPVTVAPPPAPLRGEGAPGQALQQLHDVCADQKITRLRRLTIFISGDGKQGATEVKALALAIPQLGKGEFWIEQHYTAQFDVGESIEIQFAGKWDRYKRLKQVTDTFVDDLSEFVGETTLRIDFAAGLELASSQFQSMKAIFTQLGLGNMTVSGEKFGDGTA